MDCTSKDTTACGPTPPVTSRPPSGWSRISLVSRSLKVGEYRVEVKDNEERVGVVDVLIPEPVVTVTPDSSRRGTTVTVVGSKFPASSELAVEIKYGLAGNERTITAATPDSVGSWRETFVIPTTAVIGEDHVVKAAPIDTDLRPLRGQGHPPAARTGGHRDSQQGRCWWPHDS